MGADERSLIGGIAGRRSGTPEVDNPANRDAQGRLTLQGMRNLLRAGHVISVGGRHISSEDQLPTEAQYAIQTGDTAVVQRTREQLLADQRRLELELQLLEEGNPGPADQQIFGTVPGITPTVTQSELTGVGGIPLPPNQPPTGAGPASTTVVAVDRATQQPGNLNTPGAGISSPHSAPPPPADTGTGAQQQQAASTPQGTSEPQGTGEQQQQPPPQGTELPADLPGRDAFLADPQARFTTLEQIDAASVKDLSVVTGIGDATQKRLTEWKAARGK